MLPSDDARAAYMRGRTAKAQGRLDEAAREYRLALALAPAFIEAHISLAIVLRHAGRLEQALTHLQTVRRLAPDNVAGLLNLGDLLRTLGRDDEAAAAYSTASKADARNAQAPCRLAALLLAREQFAPAMEGFEAALAIQPEMPEALRGLAACLFFTGRFDAALERLTQLLRLAPGDVEARLWLGKCLLAVGDFSAAARAFSALRQLGLCMAAASAGLAAAKDALGETDDAEQLFEEALATAPDDAWARWHQAIWLLRRGNFARGWDAYEFRKVFLFGRSSVAGALPRSPLPGLGCLWTGQDLAGQRLRLLREQGLGDEIMFASMVPELVAKGALCALECDNRLAGLFARSFPTVQVIGVETSAASGSAFDTDGAREGY